MYSLGRALLDTTPRVAALTGTVSVSPTSALQSVLAAMTEPDPRRRASLMNLLDVSPRMLTEYACPTAFRYRRSIQIPARYLLTRATLNPARFVRSSSKDLPNSIYHHAYTHADTRACTSTSSQSRVTHWMHRAIYDPLIKAPRHCRRFSFSICPRDHDRRARNFEARCAHCARPPSK